MGRLLNASILATVSLIGLIQAHDSNQAASHEFEEDSGVQGIAAALSDTSDAGQCVKLDVRQAGGQAVGQALGECIEINGGQNGIQHGGQNGGQNAGKHSGQKGNQNGSHNNGQNGNGGNNGGLGGGVGNAHTTITDILTLGGTGIGGINLSILTQATGGAAAVTHFTTVTTTVTAASAAAPPPPSQAASQQFTLPNPSVVAGSSPDISATATISTPPAVGAPNSSPVAASQPTAPSALAPPPVGSPGALASGTGATLSDGTCNCMCLCDPGSFPLSAAAASPQINPTTLQTVVSTAGGTSSTLPAAITDPASTISLPTSIVAATGSPSIPDPAQPSPPAPAATTDSTSISVSSAPVANGVAGSPAENTATVNSINISTLSLTSNIVLGSLAQPTVQS